MRRLTSLVVLIILILTGLSIDRTLIAADADVNQLTAALSGTDAQARLDAADQLTHLGSAAKSAVGALAQALTDPNAELRWRAARALAAVGPGASDAAPALVTAMNDSETLVRAQVAHALRRIGVATPEVATALASHVTDPSEQVRREVLKALIALPPNPEIVRPALIKALESADPTMAAAAVQTFAEQGTAVVPRLIEGLKHKEAQYWCCLALGQIGPDAKDAVPGLIEVLSGDRPDVVLQALVALAEIGPASEPAVPQMVRLLDSPIAAVQMGAAFALGKLRVASAVPQLKAHETGTNDPLVKTIAAWALANIHPDDATAAAATTEVIAATKNEDPRVRAWAASGLGELSGAWGADVIPALVGLLQDKDRVTSANAARALAAAGKKAVPPLLTALQIKELRNQVLAVLLKIGPDASSAASSLAASLSDSDPEFRRELLFVLGAMGPSAAPVVDAIVAKLNDPEMRVRYAACFALGRIGPAAKAATDALKKDLTSDDAFLPVASAWALTKILPGDPQILATAVPVLAGALPKLAEMPKLEVIRSLGELGAAAKPADAALKATLDDPSQEIRDAAREALEQITDAK
jgi:HEAT repeat protein